MISYLSPEKRCLPLGRNLEIGVAHIFFVSLLLTQGIHIFGFLVYALFKTEKLFDLAGGLNFVAIALVAMVLDGS